MPEIVNSVDLSDAPGGDLSLDDIFGEGASSVSASNTNTQQVITNESEPFLKTSTGTVYKTVEDAVKGTEHKDSLIADLRQQLNSATGHDPLKKNQQQVEGRKSYQADRDAYFRDLSRAVEEKNPEKYLEVQSQLIMDTLAPLGPTISSFVRSQAIETVEHEIADFRKFANSDEYKQTLDSFPLLKEAINVAESNPQAGNQLPEFYKMAYHVHHGVKLPELVQQARNGQGVQQTRPTVQSNQVAPPPTQGTQSQAQPSLETKEGRKAIIEQQERLGVQNWRL